MKMTKKIKKIYKDKNVEIEIAKDTAKILAKFFSFTVFCKIGLVKPVWEIYKKAEYNLQKQYRARKPENRKIFEMQANFYAFLLFATGFGLSIAELLRQ